MRVNLAARATAAAGQRARTRQRLLDAAASVIAVRGLEAASVEDIVSAAGVARGTFYNYFPTTADLLQALNDHLSDRLTTDLMERLQGVVDPPMRIALAAHFQLARAAAEPALGWVTERVGLQVPQQDLQARRFEDTFRRGISEGRFPDCDLAGALAFAMGALRSALQDSLSGKVPPEQLVTVVALVLAGIGLDRAEAFDISHRAFQAARA